MSYDDFRLRYGLKTERKNRFDNILAAETGTSLQFELCHYMRHGMVAEQVDVEVAPGC